MQNKAVKTEEEISLIVKSAEIIDSVFDEVLKSIAIGQTEKEVAEFIFEKAIEFGKLAIEMWEKEWNITEGEWVDIHKREIERLLDKIRI